MVMIPPSFYPEVLALVFGVLLLVSLVAKPGGVFFKIFYPLAAIGLISCFLAGIMLFHHAEETCFYDLLKSSFLFRSVRISIYFSAILLVRQIFNSHSIQDKRKRELVFMLALMVFFASMLILSVNLFISFLCLLGLSTAGLFMGGAPFRGRSEGEAVFKFWYQYSLTMVLGLFSLTLLAFVAGSLDYDALRGFYAISATHNLFIFWVMLGLAPMFFLAGLFPFHFITIDRDHGIAWPLQASETLLISGVGTISLVKAAVHFFYQEKNIAGEKVLTLLMVLGFVGLLWSILGAITQKSTKRFMAFFSAALWSICLITVASPSPQSLATIVYSFLCISISLLLILGGITQLHEKVGEEENWSTLMGLGGRLPQDSRYVLLGLLSFLFLPPSFGFSVLLNLLGTMYEQKSLILISLTCLAVFLIFMAALRLLSVIYFQDAKSELGELVPTSGGNSVVDRLLFVFCAAIVFGFGIWGDALFQSLLASAKIFIIS